jgi:hypothetical protein
MEAMLEKIEGLLEKVVVSRSSPGPDSGSGQ